MRRLGKIHILITAIMLLQALVSCDKTQITPEKPDIVDTEIKLDVSIDNGKMLSMDSEVPYNIVWNNNDAIAVINNKKLYKFVLASDSCANKTKGTFKLDKSALPVNYKEGDFDMELPVQVFYPYKGLEYDTLSYTLLYSLPVAQLNKSKLEIPLAGYASNAGNDISLKKLLSVMKFSITGTENEIINKIEIVSSYKINGKAEISISEGYNSTPNLALEILKNQGKQEEGRDYNRISVDCGDNGIPVSQLVEFYVTLPENAKNLSVQVHTNINPYYFPATQHLLSRDTILVIPEFNTISKLPAYIDNGVYMGDGILLPKNSVTNEYLIWAPVNCGYEPSQKTGGQILHRGYIFGKIYQWGRKDGQGYIDEAFKDETYPYEVSTNGFNNPQAEKFYSDWKVDETQWPANSNPCPQGWRVPTIEELISLVNGLGKNDYVTGLGNQWISSYDDVNNNHYGQPGFYFYGNSSETTHKVFFPAAGFVQYDLNGSHIRGLSGCYWSSTSNKENKAWYLDFNRKGYIDTYFDNHADGRSVRCVKSQ